MTGFRSGRGGEEEKRKEREREKERERSAVRAQKQQATIKSNLIWVILFGRRPFEEEKVSGMRVDKFDRLTVYECRFLFQRSTDAGSDAVDRWIEEKNKLRLRTWEIIRKTNIERKMNGRRKKSKSASICCRRALLTIEETHARTRVCVCIKNVSISGQTHNKNAVKSIKSMTNTSREVTQHTPSSSSTWPTFRDWTHSHTFQLSKIKVFIKVKEGKFRMKLPIRVWFWFQKVNTEQENNAKDRIKTSQKLDETRKLFLSVWRHSNDQSIKKASTNNCLQRATWIKLWYPKPQCDWSKLFATDHYYDYNQTLSEAWNGRKKESKKTKRKKARKSSPFLIQDISQTRSSCTGFLNEC